MPVTHRFFGRSIADLVMPLQREKTALKRGALDNLYLHNNPRVEVSEANAGPNTLDDLLVPRPGGVVRTKSPGGLNWQVVPDITGSIFPMLQYLDAELETRSGLSKQTQGIDANALQNQSATAVAQVFSASQMRIKLIARIMAEGVRIFCAAARHDPQARPAAANSAAAQRLDQCRFPRLEDPRRHDHQCRARLRRQGPAIRADHGDRQCAEGDAGRRQEQPGRRCPAAVRRWRGSNGIRMFLPMGAGMRPCVWSNSLLSNSQNHILRKCNR